jgi:uncharacterized membrane protein YbhN (UPF0104 family)
MKGKSILRLLISVAILIIIFWFVDLSLFLESAVRMDKLLLLLFIVLIPVSILVRSYRLKLILNKKERIISLAGSFRLNLIGLALNIFMPASTGDIAKAYYGYKKYRLREGMLSSVMVDKFMAIFAVLILGFLSSLVLGLHVFSIPFAALIVFFYFITFHPRSIPWGVFNWGMRLIKKKKLDPGKLSETYRIPPGLKVSALLISLVGWVITYVQFYILCLAFSVNVGFFYVLAIAPIITLARLFPLTFIGLGSQEVVVAYLFSLISITATMSVLVSLSFTVLNLVIPGIFGLIFIIGEKRPI